MSALFIKQDFYEIYKNAVDAENERLAQMLVEDELSKLIAFRRQEVVDFIRSKGYRVRKRASSNRIAKIIIDNRKDEKLSRGICKMIIDANAKNKQEAVSASNEFTGGGRYTPKQLPSLKIKDKEFEDKVFNTYLGINGDSVQEATQQHSMNKFELDKTNPEYKKAIIRNTVITSLITVGAIGLLYGTYYIIKKVKAGNQKPEASPMAPQAATEQSAAPSAKPEVKKPLSANDMNESNYKQMVENE